VPDADFHGHLTLQHKCLFCHFHVIVYLSIQLHSTIATSDFYQLDPLAKFTNIIKW